MALDADAVLHGEFGAKRGREGVYQILHRAASACAGNTDTAIVLYQTFSEAPEARYDIGVDLRQFVTAVRPGHNLQIFHQRIGLRPTDRYRELEKRAQRLTERQLAAAVRLALCGEDLFIFEVEATERVA